MKKTITILIISLLVFNSHAQTVLNGDFENTSISDCAQNLSNAAFTSYMPYGFAFGIQNEIDIWDSTFCGAIYFAVPAHGRRCISLHTYADADALSLLIYPPLIEGNNYQLTYYEKAVIENNIVDTLDSLVITLSADSLHLGTPIYTSQPSDQTGWVLRTVSFVAPGNFSYISFSNQGSGHGWNFIDNVKVSPGSMTYLFRGDGNWSGPANWSNNKIPPSILAPGDEIIIDPMDGGTCVLDIQYTLTPGSLLTVNSGKSFLVR